eukprot:scaffold12850_cov109-Isochrysis_galbana.AAC.6
MVQAMLEHGVDVNIQNKCVTGSISLNTFAPSPLPPAAWADSAALCSRLWLSPPGQAAVRQGCRQVNYGRGARRQFCISCLRVLCNFG